jgi:GNAT superfamily N-acetyltransferase
MMIRHAAPTDATALIQLINELGYSITKDELTANLHMYEKVQGFVFVAVEDEKVVGFISGSFIPLFHSPGPMFRITALCVLASQRGSGIGSALLQRIEEICKKKECNYIEVTSGPTRQKDAHNFYENHGYTTYKGKRFTKRLEA